MGNKWMASLSDGQSIREDVLLEQNDKLSPWLQLMDYLRKNRDKKITSIQLVINGKLFNSPGITNKKNAKFVNDVNPDRLWCAKKDSMVFVGGWNQDAYYGLSYRMNDYRHWLWVNIATNETFFEVKKIQGNQRETKIEEFYDEVS